MIIRKLSSHIINQIAAGEVVERPASVIKELVENAIDAGASVIDVIIHEGGKTYLSVSDNGSGMDADDLNLCVERHATSKIQDDDLFKIETLGFRGEALPSIGSVSRLKITTRRQDMTEGITLSVEGGIKSSIAPVSFPIGTRVEVRDLFYATPARLKFLRTTVTETTQIVDVLHRLALGHPHIKFSLINDKRTVFNFTINSLDLEDKRHQDRIAYVLGKDFTANSFVINTVQEDTFIKGYASLPTFNRATANLQFLFVNNRPVKDKVLNHALRLAYQDYMARDRHPLIVLYVTLPPLWVDMNVHPAKIEVRFRDPQKMRSQIIAAIRSGLQQNGFRTSTVLSQDAVNRLQASVSQPSLSSQPPYQPQFSLNPSFPSSNTSSQTDNLFGNQVMQTHLGLRDTHPTLKPPSVSQPYNHELIRFANSPEALREHNASEAGLDEQFMGQALAQVYKTYILSRTQDNLIITDQHAAHERLVYEKFKKAYKSGAIQKQLLLVPEFIELPPQALTLFNQHKDAIEKLGFDFDIYGKSTLIIRATPTLLGDFDIKQTVVDLIDNLEELGQGINITEHHDRFLGTLACHTSIRAGRIMNISEMNSLLRDMEQTPFSGQCNHGRPTYVKLSKIELEKLFERR